MLSVDIIRCVVVSTSRLPSFAVLRNKNVDGENPLFSLLVLGLFQSMIRTCKVNAFGLHFGLLLEDLLISVTYIKTLHILKAVQKCQ